MPTSVEKTLEYWVIAAWFDRYYKRLNERRDHPEFPRVRKLLKCFWEYQNAKNRLFQRNANDELPLVTKELGQDVYKKYDALMEFYKCYAREMSDDVRLTYDSHQGSRVYEKKLSNWVDDMFVKIRKQDEKSVEFMREHFREHFGYTPQVANIQEIGDVDCPYPFHTEKEIEQLKAKNGEKLSKCKLFFEDSGVGQSNSDGNRKAQNIINISVEQLGKGQTKKGSSIQKMGQLPPFAVPKTKAISAQIKTKKRRNASACFPQRRGK